MMEWNDWKNEYSDILKQLIIDRKQDELSSRLLENYLLDLDTLSSQKIYQDLRDILRNPIIVAGAGPSLESDITNIIRLKMQKSVNILSADGATAAFRLYDILPDVVVTDLDGELESIVWALELGSLVLIHAHGDNPHLISMFFKKFSSQLKNKKLWGSSQSDPGEHLFNFGGFTDGDRAIFMGFHFQSPLIGLIGFDFGTKIGKYSIYKSEVKKKDLTRKMKKFDIAIHLLEDYHRIHNGLRYNLTYGGSLVPGFTNIGFQEFYQKVVEYNTLPDR